MPRRVKIRPGWIKICRNVRRCTFLCIFAEKRTLMDKELYKESLSELLPDRGDPDATEMSRREVGREADEQEGRLNAASLARMKARERRELEKAERSVGEKAERHRARLMENISDIEAAEASPEAQRFLSAGPSDLAPYSGTTRREVAQLLSSLNINLNLNLSRQDTHNLLGCLLTANESQLEALYDNSRIPLAVKTIIKRIMDDSKTGNIDTIERLWDRIFGKPAQDCGAALQTASQSAIPGVIPGQPVSREALVVIRDTVFGRQ